MPPFPNHSYLLKAAKEGDISALKECLTQNPEDVNIRDQNGYAPLHHAMRHKEKAQELINLLLDFGADINIIDQSGHTPLVHTLTYNNPLALKTLINKGANIFIADHLRATPLFHATITHTRPELLKTLLQSGALNPEKDPSCTTLLHDTAVASSRYISQMLRDSSECNYRNNKKLFLLGQAANYLIAYGQPIDTQDINLIGYLTNHFSLLAYCFFIKEPLVTISTLSKVSLTFAQYAQTTQELTKTKVDIVLSLDRIFEFLPPNSLSPSLIKAKEDVLQEAAKRDHFTQTIVAAKQAKIHLFLDETQEIGLSQKPFTPPLNLLHSFIQHNLESNKDLPAFLQEIKQLYSDLLNLSQLDIYHNTFSNTLEEIRQTTEHLEIKLQSNLTNQPIIGNLEENFSDMQISGDMNDDSTSM